LLLRLKTAQEQRLQEKASVLTEINRVVGGEVRSGERQRRLKK